MKYIFRLIFLTSLLISSLFSVSIELDGTQTLLSGTDCSTASYRFGTTASYNGYDLDIILDVTEEDNDYNGSACIDMKNNVISFHIGDKDDNETMAYANAIFTIVQKNTTTPVVVNMITATNLELDSSPISNLTSTDDVYYKNPLQTLISNDSKVVLTSGSYYNNYTTKLKGNVDGNCNHSEPLPCRAGAIWKNTSSIEARVQNDNAYGNLPTQDNSDSNFTVNYDAFERLIQFSFEYDDIAPLTPQDCGDGIIQAGEESFNKLTPNMLGITTVGVNLSGSDVDVSSSFNLDAGSILVSYSSVDVRLKDGNLLFNLQHEGDQNANWTVKYNSPHKVRLSHGGALMEQKEDWFTSSDNKLYTFKSQLKNGLSHSISGNTYRVRNNTNSKIWDNNFLWESNTVANTFTFEFHSSAPSNIGKGSAYSIFLETSIGEQCDDANNISGDGCSESCQIEENTFHGHFNIERTNSKTQKIMTKERNAWYTQIVGRDFDYSVVFYEDDFSSEKNISNVSLKIELLNMDMNTSLYEYKFHIPANVSKSRIDISKEISNFFKKDLNKLPATKNARFKVTYGVDANNNIIQKDCLSNPQFCSNFATDYAKDNFAIRPESFFIKIADGSQERVNSREADANLTMSAGYEYNLTVLAKRYDNDITPSLGYNKNIHASFDFNSTGMTSWADSSPITESINFVDGLYNNNAFKHDEVGHYSLLISSDENWTNIDHLDGDCIVGSSQISADGNSQSGCNIAQESTAIALTFNPDHFKVDLNIGNLPASTHDDFIYMTELNNTFNNVAINISGEIIAQTEDNLPTKNFTIGCMAKDVTLDLNASTLSVEGVNQQIKTIAGTNVYFTKYIQFNDNVNDSNIINDIVSLGGMLTLTKDKFLDENNGTATLDIRYNLNKNITEPINPVQVSFNGMKASSPDAKSTAHNIVDNYIPKGDKPFNAIRNFYYARVVSSLTKYPRVNMNISPLVRTPLNVDIYCKTNVTNHCANTNVLANTSLSSSTREQNGWYFSSNHNGNVDGNVTTLTPNFTTVSINSNSTITLPNGSNGLTMNTFDDCSNPLITVTIATTPALTFNPSQYTISCTDNNASQWTGTGKTGNVLSIKPKVNGTGKMDW